MVSVAAGGRAKGPMAACDDGAAAIRAGLYAAAARSYGTGVGRYAAAAAAGEVHGFPAALSTIPPHL